jgi:NADH-quinone oxidoreductase subunit J
MIIQVLAFYLFAGLAVASGVMVIVARNPVHSVLFLILAFFNAAGLFVLMGAEFLAMILVIVYVGAVAVLFLFVVMMLDIDFVELRQGFVKYLPVGAVVGIILFVELVLIVGSWVLSPLEVRTATDPILPFAQVQNTTALGLVLYTKYIYLFQASGMILLVAMIGAIVLTHRSRAGVKRQRVQHQIARDPERTIEIKKMPVGQGVGPGGVGS